MSRVAKKPITVPAGVEVTLNGSLLTVKGKQGVLSLNMHQVVEMQREDSVLNFGPRDEHRLSDALAGTTRALVANMVAGVSAGFERKLQLVGVGYRAQMQGKVLNLALGMSHPINFPVPDGITIETPSQTEILVKGSDKQKVGQVAAKIRAYRSPEPYKGKGIRYANEVITLKEAKKK